MADHQLISLWSGTDGAGRQTIAQGLADTWLADGQLTLVIKITAQKQESDPATWLPRFKTVSPLMLRNFLAGYSNSFHTLNLNAWPERSVLIELLATVRAAYPWTLVLGSSAHAESAMTISDAADLLLWIGTERTDRAHQRFLNQLTQGHIPHAYVRTVLNRSTTLVSVTRDSGIIASISDDPDGFRRKTQLAQLAALLKSSPTLFKPRSDAHSADDSEKAVDEIKRRVQPQLLKALEGKSQLDAGVAQETIEACLVQDVSLPASREQRGEILTRVLDDVLGLGPLEPLLKDPEISEIMVNGHGCVYVEKKGKLHPSGIQFTSEKQLRTVIDRIVSPIGRRVDESMPLCDARLADGSRVNIVLPPLALDGPVITIRKFSARHLNFDDLVELRSVNRAMADFLKNAVVGHRNILVSGGTGSGKTTLLNALSSVIPNDERIVTIEDAAELKLQKPHVVRLESRPANAEGEGSISIRRLVMNALRMRPDRIVVGECRGGEALDMLQAMNTGHDGSLTTVHANSPRDALGRLETLVLMAGMDLPLRVVREQIRSAVHLVVQQARLHDGSRKVTSITEITGMEGDRITTQELFRHTPNGFESTGLISAHPL